MKREAKQKNAKKTVAVIKAVVFDFGDVIVKDNELVLEKKYNLHRKSRKEQKRYHDALAKVEVQKMSVQKMAAITKEVFGYEGPAMEIMEKIIKAPLIKQNWRLVQTLKKTYKVAILTNNKKTWPQKSAKHVGISLKGIPVFNSADIGVRKPKPYIYKYALKKLRLKAKEVIFVDDREKNLKGARKVGMKTILFKGNHQALLKSLKKLGVEVRI